MVNIYVLKLKRGKYYWQTNHTIQRFNQHQTGVDQKIPYGWLLLSIMEWRIRMKIR